MKEETNQRNFPNSENFQEICVTLKLILNINVPNSVFPMNIPKRK